PAMLHNIPPPAARPDAPSTLFPEYRLVDPELAMLRVDQLDPATGRYRPSGAFSIFAMHGTGNAPANDLLDADIHGIVERQLERHIDRDLNHHSDRPFVPRAFHLFANGTEGDVSPAWPPQSRCAVPVLAVLPALDGPFTRSLWQWRPPTAAHVAACQHAARQAVVRIGDAGGSAAGRRGRGVAHQGRRRRRAPVLCPGERPPAGGSADRHAPGGGDDDRRPADAGAEVGGGARTRPAGERRADHGSHQRLPR